MTEGYSASQLINQLHDKVVQMDQLTDQQKAAMCERLAVSLNNVLIFANIDVMIVYQ